MLLSLIIPIPSGPRQIPAQQSEDDLLAKVLAAATQSERKALIASNGSLLTGKLEDAVMKEGMKAGSGGGYVKAADFFELASDIAKTIGDRKGLCEALSYTGVAYRFIGDYLQALEASRQVIAVAREISDREVLAEELWEMGFVYQLLGDYPSAMSCLDESLKVSQQTGDKKNIARALLNRGAVYHDLGNYAGALKDYVDSLNLAEEVGDTRAIAGCLRSISGVHLDQGNYSLALEFAQRSVDILRKAQDTRELCSGLIALGNAQAELRNFKDAIESNESCLKIAQSLGLKQEQADVLSNIGEVHAKQGDLAEGIEYHNRGMRIYEEVGDKRNLAESLSRIASLYIEKGEYARAAELAERAVSIGAEIGAGLERWDALWMAGRAYRGLNKEEKAEDALKGAIAGIETARWQVAGGEQQRQHYFESNTGPYYTMTGLMIDQHRYPEALAFAERAKARVLLDVFQSGKVNLTRSLTGDEQKRERDLYSRLASLNSQIAQVRLHQSKQSNQQSLLAGLEADQRKTRLELESFQANLYAAHPTLRVQRGEFRPITLEECQQLLPDDSTALLEFVVSDERVHLFLLTRDKDSRDAPLLKVYETPVKTKDLIGLSESFRQRVARRDVTFGELAKQLYDLLIRPAAADLARKANLIIVPDGSLWELPFQALLSPRGRFMIQDHAISYAPSLTALREMCRPGRRVQQGSRNTLLAFGNALVKSETSSRISQVFLGNKLQPIPQAERQVKEIAAIYGSDHSQVYIGQDATEQKLKEQIGDFRIVHIATHAIVNSRNPLYSQIVLSQSAGSTDDGILEAWEVMNLDMKADLAVLSACDTAGGKVGAGEGMIGFSWAFFVAGCPAILASQWSVEADSASRAMIEFHRNFNAGMKKSEALRQAQLTLLKSRDTSDPFYWAAFVVVGEPN